MEELRESLDDSYYLRVHRVPEKDCPLYFLKIICRKIGLAT
jgi:hypothetical protein